MAEVSLKDTKQLYYTISISNAHHRLVQFMKHQRYEQISSKSAQIQVLTAFCSVLQRKRLCYDNEWIDLVKTRRMTAFAAQTNYWGGVSL